MPHKACTLRLLALQHLPVSVLAHGRPASRSLSAPRLQLRFKVCRQVHTIRRTELGSTINRSTGGHFEAQAFRPIAAQDTCVHLQQRVGFESFESLSTSCLRHYSIDRPTPLVRLALIRLACSRTHSAKRVRGSGGMLCMCGRICPISADEARRVGRHLRAMWRPHGVQPARRRDSRNRTCMWVSDHQDDMDTQAFRISI